MLSASPRGCLTTPNPGLPAGPPLHAARMATRPPTLCPLLVSNTNTTDSVLKLDPSQGRSVLLWKSRTCWTLPLVGRIGGPRQRRGLNPIWWDPACLAASNPLHPHPPPWSGSGQDLISIPGLLCSQHCHKEENVLCLKGPPPSHEGREEKALTVTLLGGLIQAAHQGFSAVAALFSAGTLGRGTKVPCRYYLSGNRKPGTPTPSP